MGIRTDDFSGIGTSSAKFSTAVPRYEYVGVRTKPSRTRVLVPIPAAGGAAWTGGNTKTQENFRRFCVSSDVLASTSTSTW